MVFTYACNLQVQHNIMYLLLHKLQLLHPKTFKKLPIQVIGQINYTYVHIVHTEIVYSTFSAYIMLKCCIKPCF